MGNPSKLNLYVASKTINGGITTVVKPMIKVSKRLSDSLSEFAPYLLSNLVKPKEEQRFEGNVKLPASLDEATIQLLHVVSPALAFLNEMFSHITLEVMFNEPSINSAIKQGYLDKWRANRFEYKTIRRRKEAIAYSGKWYAFDLVLRELEGDVIWYNNDETMNDLVESLNPKRRKENDLDSSLSVNSDIAGGDSLRVVGISSPLSDASD
jgi:hypothetical protein